MMKIIIDIQDRNEYNHWHYPGSINIPYDDIMNNYRTYLNKNDTYYFYCKSGRLAKRLATILNYLGYDAHFIEK